MSVVFILVIFSITGTLGARQPDIDINRIKLLPREEYNSRRSNFHNRRSLFNQIRRHDDDNYSSRISELRAPMHIFYDASSITKAKTDKVYQPREDPRFFYQSDSYVEEANRKNLNNEVSSIYLGRGVIRANDDSRRPLPIRIRNNELNRINEETCVRCPHDRTLIAKAGVDRAVLQYPRILTCSGRKAARSIRFSRMYGPEFGTPLKEGSHMIVGQITSKGQTLQTCKMQIHVLLQSCPVPEYLKSQCEDQNKTCRFKCRDSKAELRGHSTLICGDDLHWSDQLPVCRARTWCSSPPPPEHGRISCKGVTVSNGRGLAEGSSCRIKCARGLRWSPRSAIAVCRKGFWTHGLTYGTIWSSSIPRKHRYARFQPKDSVPSPSFSPGTQLQLKESLTLLGVDVCRDLNPKRYIERIIQRIAGFK